jgi:hypothetical protein
MKSFIPEINQFLLTGEFTNNLDNFGNINIFSVPNNINEEYVSFRLLNNLYDNKKIKELYDVSMEEIATPTVSELIETESNKDTISRLNIEVAALNDQLNAVINSSKIKTTDDDVAAAKNLIIQLRIQLGEGKVESDFSSQFPYLKNVDNPPE